MTLVNGVFYEIANFLPSIDLYHYNVQDICPEKMIWSPVNLTDAMQYLSNLSFGANLLGVLIALLAFIISVVAFLLPLMITAVGNYQSAFFNTVTNPQCISAIKRTNKTCDIKLISKNIKNNVEFMNSIYRTIMISSIFAFMFTIGSIELNLFLYRDSRNLVYFLLLILTTYLLIIIFCLILILMKMFKSKGQGSYVILAELQRKIISEIYKDPLENLTPGTETKAKDVLLIYHRKDKEEGDK
jgi:hypothetical protein